MSDLQLADDHFHEVVRGEAHTLEQQAVAHARRQFVHQIDLLCVRAIIAHTRGRVGEGRMRYLILEEIGD